MKSNPKQIILIGGGYASIWAYRSIVRKLRTEIESDQVRITVICPEEFHFFHGWTAESLTGIIQDQNRMSQLTDIFKYAVILQGKVTRIDVICRSVSISMKNGSRRHMICDHLFLGMGATDNTDIPGLAEYAYPLKSHSTYLRAKIRIQWLVREAAKANPGTARRMLRFVIAGAGYTGVEIASNLTEWLTVLKKSYPTLKHINPSIYLINSKNEILPDLHSDFNRMRRYAEKILDRYEIKIIHQAKIEHVTNQGVYLSNGAFIESRLIISTIGQKRKILNGTEKMERDLVNRIKVNAFLQINHHSNIWGAGDSVNVLQVNTHLACPSNALWAIKQGEHAGINIARSIRSQPLKPFMYNGLGQCASLGIGKGIGEIYGIQFTSWVAWIMRWFFFQYFMPVKKIMWREIKDWMILFITGRRAKLTSFYSGDSKILPIESVRSGILNQPIYHN